MEVQVGMPASGTFLAGKCNADAGICRGNTADFVGGRFTDDGRRGGRGAFFGFPGGGADGGIHGNGHL